MSTKDLTLACVFLPIFVYVWYFRSHKSSALPPGPKPLPIVGNILDLAPMELWLHATQWGKQFGSLVRMHVFGVNIMFVNSIETATELLELRGATYSGRPDLVMACELCRCNVMLVYTSYNSKFRRQRALLYKAMSPSAVASYEPLFISSTHLFLVNLHKSPESFFTHIRHYAGGVGLSVTYGHEARSPFDPYLVLLEDCLDILTNGIAGGGGIWLVDAFPVLRHLPRWMPGAGFKRKAEKWGQKMQEFADWPFMACQDTMKKGLYKLSFCSTLLEDASYRDRPGETGEDRKRRQDTLEYDVKCAANSMYSSSLYAELATVSQLILALVLNPSAQKKAQEEIDAVVGNDRLPGSKDRDQLIYVEALYKESLRWGAPVPLTMARRVMKADTYQGMYVPEGSFVLANIWAMLRDPELYPSPDSFIPERFLEPCTPEEERRRDPKSFAFGFGRRICPGMHLVDSSMWLLIANMLATFDFSKAKDDNGVEQEINVAYHNAIFRIPTEFKCDIRPRNEKALKLLKELELQFDA